MKRIACLVVAALSLTIGCVAPTDQEEEKTAISATEAITADLDIDPFRLTGVVANADGTYDLTGTDRHGTPYVARFTSSTVFRQARLDRFQPVDPCRDIANTYNTSTPTSADGYATISALAGSSCRAKVLIGRSATPNVLKSFQPIP
jgi:hypothetical protein